MKKLSEWLYVPRYNIRLTEPLVPVQDGDDVSYSAMQHHYKECLEHGHTLEEAIELMEQRNGS